MRARATMATACVAVLAAGCGGEGTPTAEPPQAQTSSSGAGSQDEGGGDPPSSKSADGGGTSATEELLLPQQVQLQVGGDGLFLHCMLRDGAPASYRRDPGVWLHELFSVTEYPMVVMLCLRGFRTDQPLEVEVAAGDVVVASKIEPVVGSPPDPVDFGYEDAPATTLFDPDSNLPVYTLDYDDQPFEGPPRAMASRMWTFVPPAAAREALAITGELRLTVTQGSTTATEVHEIAVPATRASFGLDTPNGRQLVAHGYPAGPVPLGLYRKNESGEQGSLVREVGVVDVPPSRVGTWPWPSDLLDNLEPGAYCLLPPVTEKASCDTTRVWPPYPGAARVGDSGPVVAAWQAILIAAGLVSDIPENRDGVYRPPMREAVADYLSARGMNDPRDGGRLDEDVYEAITDSRR